MRPTAPLTLALSAVLTAGALTGCSIGPDDDPNTVEIAFPKDIDNNVTVRDDYLEFVAKQFEEENPGKKVKLVPIQAPQNDYYTKIQVMMRSPNTAPDLVYEDTFLLQSDIESDYLQPLDEYLGKWDDWDRFEDNAKRAGLAEDGKTYGVPDGTDTRGLWFNKKIFKKAGLPTDWTPKTWDDVLDAARTIKKKVPDVTPFNIFTGKAVGEAAAMQGFEMLLYGTQDQLYDEKAKKWVVGSKGFRDSLEFVDTVFSEKLGPDVSDALSPDMQTQVMTDHLPQEKLAIALDGSWINQQWIKTGGSPWPEWNDTMGVAPMPTQDGGEPGSTSMSGGWAWSIPRKSGNHDLSWKMIETLQRRENAREWCVRGSQIAVREDVAADPAYLNAIPRTKFFTDLVDVTHYRPALPVYPRVSEAITVAMEKVTTGDASPEQGARSYDEQVRSITEGEVVER
ncbi:extracellular solute-binding protein [Streptomyces phytohabitans]|uniref:extracellular solute-binding protein n=1 Tax=Streptomyces phytohabitans TaxID=1150371 RepID=UPI00345BAF3D